MTSCERINKFYQQPSSEELVALAHSKYESLNDTLIYDGYTEYESTIKYYEILEDVKRLNPNHERVWIALANAYANKGMAKEWKENYDKALFLNPDRNLGWRGFNLLYRFRDYEKALADFEGVKLKNNSSVDYIYQTNINYFIALCHMQLGDYINALEIFDLFIDQEIKALSEPFINETAYLYKGIIFIKIKDYGSAIEELNKGLVLNPHLADFYFHKARSLCFLHKFDEALNNLNNCLAYFEEGYNNTRYNGEEFEEIFYNDIIELKAQIKKASKKEKGVTHF